MFVGDVNPNKPTPEARSTNSQGQAGGEAEFWHKGPGAAPAAQFAPHPRLPSSPTLHQSSLEKAPLRRTFLQRGGPDSSSPQDTAQTPPKHKLAEHLQRGPGSRWGGMGSQLCLGTGARSHASEIGEGHRSHWWEPPPPPLASRPGWTQPHRRPCLPNQPHPLLGWRT